LESNLIDLRKFMSTGRSTDGIKEDIWKNEVAKDLDEISGAKDRCKK
jgi:hypothetical protein